MRVLILPPPAASHVTAMVPLAWALRTSGHEVLVAGQPDVLRVARAAGLNTLAVGAAGDPVDDEQHRMPEEMFPATGFGDRDTDLGRHLWGAAADAWARHAGQHAEAYLAAVPVWRPDVIVSDGITLVGRLVSAVLDVPLVFLCWGTDPTGGPFEDAARELMRPLCDRYGVPALAEPAAVLDPCPPSLQVPDAPRHRVRFRYVPYNGSGVLPAWAVAPRDRPRVCVCPGTSMMTLTGPAPVRRVLDALAGVDADVVLAVTARHRRLIGAVPGVEFVESLPLNLFLDACDLVVHHGGAGTGLTATAYGLPQLVLPMWTDQFAYAGRLAGAGAGIAVADHDGQRDVAGLRRAATVTLTDPAYRQAAQRLRDEIRMAPPLHTVLPLLESLATAALTPAR